MTKLILCDDDDLFYGEAAECCQLDAKIWKSAKTESKHSNISYFLSIEQILLKHISDNIVTMSL